VTDANGKRVTEADLAGKPSAIRPTVSASVMWWKRRPKGTLGVPPLPTDKGVFRGLIAILVVGGVIFPLVGVSLIVMLVLDWTFARK
jgi:uncharacterized iron-regulated membrane protein